jgi:predicted O-methyltransferase YrrM
VLAAAADSIRDKDAKMSAAATKGSDAERSAMAVFESGDNLRALELLERLPSPSPQAKFCEAVCHARLGRYARAVGILRPLSHFAPAAQLLAELEPLAGRTSATNLGRFSYSKNFYGESIIGPATIARYAQAPETWQKLLTFHKELAPDDYVEYLDKYYREGLKRFGDHWAYLDIVNVLFAASTLIQPRNYLEIGVRRGRSMSAVVRGSPAVNVTACDMWIPGYAGMDNPGPAFVQHEIKKHGHTGTIQFINGDSHVVLPKLFKENIDLKFDMITVDGDHSDKGALDDLDTVIPRLEMGGVIVFDDIAHPLHPTLLGVWREALKKHAGLCGFEYGELGYGIAFAVRTRN